MAYFMMIMGIGGNAIVRGDESISYDILSRLTSGTSDRMNEDGEYCMAYDNNLRLHVSTYEPGLRVPCPNCGGATGEYTHEGPFLVMEPCYHCGMEGTVDSGDELVLVAQAYQEMAERMANASVIPFDAPEFDHVLEPAVLPADDIPF
jgi:hypothetical protein